MNLQLPPDVAMQKKLQAVQQNQLYSIALQIYAAIISNPNTGGTPVELAESAIEAAKVFTAAVNADMKRSQHEPMRPNQD